METLDLHGNDYEAAPQLVHSFIYNHQPPVKIITGQSPRMRDIVTEIVTIYGYHYHYERLTNTGCLVITEQSL